jgi:hypothetical protein
MSDFAMPPIEQSIQPVILLVTASSRPGLADWRGPIESAGAIVQIVPDVYTAMAELADESAAQHVVIDERELNDSESAFISLAPQYFAITVHQYSDSGADAERFLATLFGGAPVEDVPATLSTDGVTSDDEPCQSMHDAVRQRMSSDSPPAVTRRAPQTRPPPIVVRPAAAESGLSKEELDALLAEGQEMEEGPAVSDEESSS